MTEEEQIEAVKAEKAKRGKQLIILGHHYQRDSIVDVSDHRGDSFALARVAASSKTAKYLVFCGVHFMAESARILATPQQRVFLPNHSAGCPMADMADIGDVEYAWQVIENELGNDPAVPITYINSSVDIKAFCGKHGGAVCTSSNANKVLSWALESGKNVMFFPDEHLGRNTANALGIPGGEQMLWDPHQSADEGVRSSLKNARVILWKGYCHVHTHFTVAHVEEIRNRYPEAKIIVHPECPQEVIALVDDAGSTHYIVNYVKKAPPGTQIAIGTEINLVSRLAHDHPDKTIMPLSRSLCHNMYKINPGVLLHTLENLPNVGEIIVDDAIASDARKALEKMLELA